VRKQKHSNSIRMQMLEYHSDERGCLYSINRFLTLVGHSRWISR